MSSKTSAALASPIHPPVGTLIDGGSLELVEVLGVGGYGVVYRAVDTRHMPAPKSYAVKCLVTSGHQTLRQRQIHIREIALHQIASAHPGVVTLHRVVEQFNHTYIIMDYAPWSRVWINRGYYVHPYVHPWVRPVAPRVEVHRIVRRR